MLPGKYPRNVPWSEYCHQHGLSTAFRAQGTRPRSPFGRFKLKHAYSHERFEQRPPPRTTLSAHRHPTMA
eukprot:3758876-Prymnesium_polylepis.1